jgi:uncharacterized protein (DUF2249 family)
MLKSRMSSTVPAQRQAKELVRSHQQEISLRIIASLDALQAGQSLVLVSEHDPVWMHGEIEAVRPGEFCWENLENGPRVWRTRIARHSSPAELVPQTGTTKLKEA